MKSHIFAVRLPAFDSCQLQLGLIAGDVIFLNLDFVEDVDEFTRPRGGGQLPKYGAVEEKLDMVFLKWMAIKRIYGGD